MYKMKEGYRDDEVTLYPTYVFSVNNWALKSNQPEEPPFITHMLAICAVDKPVAFKAPKTSSNVERVPQGTKPGAKPGHKKHSSSKQPFVSSKEARKRKGASFIARQVEEEEASNTIKLEDLSKLVSNVEPSFKDLDSPKDDPVIVVDDSEVDEDDEIHHTLNVETEDTSVPKSLSPRFERNSPQALEDFTKTVTSLTSQVAKLKTLQWELPAAFLVVPSQVKMVQAKLKTLDALPSLLNKVTNALNQFAQAITSKKAGSDSVPLVGQAGTQPDEGEKNTNQATTSQFFQRRAKKENLNKQPNLTTPPNPQVIITQLQSQSSSQPQGEHIKQDKGKM
ncbi:hypothetical protein Tco_0761281 [Tanacetum coccineum]